MLGHAASGLDKGFAWYWLISAFKEMMHPCLIHLHAISLGTGSDKPPPSLPSGPSTSSEREQCQLHRGLRMMSLFLGQHAVATASCPPNDGALVPQWPHNRILLHC